MSAVDEVGKILWEINEKNSGSLSTDDIVFALLNRSPCDRCAAMKSSKESDEQKACKELAENSGLTYYNQIHSSRRIFGRFITLYRRVIRRFLRYLFLPVLDKQSRHNAQTAALLDAHRIQLDSIKSSIAEMRAILTEVKINLAELNRNN
jgi:hypothetical protein